MDYKEDLKSFTEKYTYSEISAGGGNWRYVLGGKGLGRTIVLLNGGTNVSEMWMNYLDDLSQKFQVLIFDYPIELKTNEELVAGMKDFFKKLNIYMPILIGASYGGYVAQIYTKKYPDSVGNLILLSTGAIDKSTIKTLKRQYFFAPALLWFMKHCNYEKMKKVTVKKCRKYTKNESAEVQAYADEMFTSIFKDYKREKDIHITGLLIDLLNQTPATAETFQGLKGKILMILPKNDFFSSKMQKSLSNLMGNPKTIVINGCHISTVLDYKMYIKEILDFLG